MEPSSLHSLSEEIPEESEDSSCSFSSSSHPPRPASQTSLQKYSPSDWSGYFHKEKDVAIEGSNNVFHIYEAGSEGPVVFCLHGGGYSGLSFALSAKKISEKARVVAMDLRGHGKSSTERDLDLSIETLCNDVVAVLKTIYGDSAPAIILVGHSMGGSVAVHVAARKVIPNLHGLVVVDVVEGTAMASLIHMQKILSNRMQFFPSLEKAIEWSIKGGTLRNLESARISVPSTLKFDESKECYTYRTALEETQLQPCSGGYDRRLKENVEYLEELKILAKDEGVLDRVTFVTSCSTEERNALLSDCICVLYTPKDEHFGIVPLEAMASQKPVIACNSGGPVETIKNGVTGFLCNPIPSDFSKAMSLLLADSTLATKMGREARRHMSEMFSAKRFGDELNDYVLDVFHRRYQ